jgi:hypothetical protein
LSFAQPKSRISPTPRKQGAGYPSSLSSLSNAYRALSDNSCESSERLELPVASRLSGSLITFFSHACCFCLRRLKLVDFRLFSHEKRSGLQRITTGGKRRGGLCEFSACVRISAIYQRSPIPTFYCKSLKYTVFLSPIVIKFRSHLI